jgi:hypothetical protein
LAGGLGFEPRFSESESDVLPLNYPPPRGHSCYPIWGGFCKSQESIEVTVIFLGGPSRAGELSTDCCATWNRIEVIYYSSRYKGDGAPGFLRSMRAAIVTSVLLVALSLGGVRRYGIILRGRQLRMTPIISARAQATRYSLQSA